MTEDEIRAAAERYRTAPQRAWDELSAALREAAAGGWRQVDIIKTTGFSREQVRRLLNPEARERVQQAEAARRAARNEELATEPTAPR